MFVFKPTLSKAYLTLILSFPIFSPVLFLLLWIYDEIVFLITYSSLAILASYFVACVLAVLFTQFWKRKRLWQPTFLKTVLAVLFELIFFVVGVLFLQTDAGSQFLDILFPINGINPCPAGSLFNCRLDVRIFLYFPIFSLVNACISYTLSCVVTDFMKNMKGRKK